MCSVPARLPLKRPVRPGLPSLKMTAAEAPAASAFATFWAKVHVPRWIRAMLPGRNPAKSEACAAAGRAGGGRRGHDDAACGLELRARRTGDWSRVEVRAEPKGMRRRRLLAQHRGPDEAEVVELVLLQRHVVARCPHDVGHVVGRGLVAGLPRVAGRMAVGARIGVRNLLELDHMGPEVVLGDAVDELLRGVVDPVGACRRVGVAGRSSGIGARRDHGQAPGHRHRCGSDQREPPSSTSSVSWAHRRAPLLTAKPAGVVVDEPSDATPLTPEGKADLGSMLKQGVKPERPARPGSLGPAAARPVRH